MKRIILAALTAALAVSLWFNWRNRPSVAIGVAAPAKPAETTVSKMSVKLDEIDFSGTGLADEAWQLQTPRVEGQIPAALPSEESGEPLPPLPTPDEWNPDVKLKLESRPPCIRLENASPVQEC